MPLSSFLFSAAVLFASNVGTRQGAEITAEEISSHVKVLASDAFAGREAGTAGSARAARYVAREFQRAGLAPILGRSFRAPFEFPSGVRARGANRLEWSTDEQKIRLKHGRDFRPADFSSSGSANGKLVFAGYGINAPDLGYSDYEGIDVTGKVVLVLRYSPDGTNPHGAFAPYAAARRKAMEARERGATAIVFVTGPAEESDPDHLPNIRDGEGGSDADIPSMVLTQRSGDAITAAAGLNLSSLQEELNARRRRSAPLPVRIRLSATLKRETGRTENVIGVVEGIDPLLRDEVVVIGAHYDHLGMGGAGSLAPDTVAVHNGADDNASGVAGLLELAEWFASHPQPRTLVLVAFGAEEKGLLGSAAFVYNPPAPLDRIVAMINLDMIGRMINSSLVVGGSGTAPEWKEMVTRAASVHGLKPRLDESGFGASDHQSFTLKEIPVLFFFTGTHGDYHRPSDDWENINADGEEQIVQMVRQIISEVAARPARPLFVKGAATRPMRGGFAVSLGTIPDYAAVEAGGMKLAGVREGAPADKAGLRGGDVIARMAGKQVTSVYDFMYILQELKAGVAVPVVVSRGGQTITLTVVPEAKRD